MSDFVRKADPNETLETILLRILAKHGSCLFEIAPPSDNGTKWEVAGYTDIRFIGLGSTIREAAQRLEWKLRQDADT